MAERKQFIVALSASEKQLFAKAANDKGWAIAQYIRIAAKAAYLKAETVLPIEECFAQATFNDADPDVRSMK